MHNSATNRKHIQTTENRKSNKTWASVRKYKLFILTRYSINNQTDQKIVYKSGRHKVSAKYSWSWLRNVDFMGKHRVITTYTTFFTKIHIIHPFFHKSPKWNVTTSRIKSINESFTNHRHIKICKVSLIYVSQL